MNSYNTESIIKKIAANVSSFAIGVVVVVATILTVNSFFASDKTVKPLTMPIQHLSIPLENTNSSTLIADTNNITPTITPTLAPTATITPTPTHELTPTPIPTNTPTPQPTLTPTPTVFYDENYHPYKPHGKKLKELYKQITEE